MDNKENEMNGISESYEEDSNPAIVYERYRIKTLAEQRDEVQKKTFTNWVNSHLRRKKEQKDNVNDLYTDLQDGRILMNLLEILSGDKLGRPEKGKMRIHCIENVAKCLKFLAYQHVYLENMGSHDIVDGNPTLTLGLIWTIILRYQIQDIQFDDTDLALTGMAPKDALLLWCQMKTASYDKVNIRNFTTSWKDGLGFCALLHKHKPEAINFQQLSKENAVENLTEAFEKFEEEYKIKQLLEPTDVAVDQPDEKSIMTYVATLYHELNKIKNTDVQGKRVGKLIDSIIDIEDQEFAYEKLCGDLLKWIKEKIDWLDNEPLKDSLPTVQEQLEEFKTYRLEEKPPKFNDRGQMEMQFFEIQSRLLASQMKVYIPEEGKLISDVNKAWENLEKSEHSMEIRLYEEMIRQQRLNQLADRFFKKAESREKWLYTNNELVQQEIFGNDLVTVDAAIKKHEALENDIYAAEERINRLTFILEELDTENYYKCSEVREKHDYIMDLWHKLLEDLKKRRDRLDNCREIQVILQERNYSFDLTKDYIIRFQNKDYGKHIIGVDKILEDHKILVGDSKNLEQKIDDINDRISDFNLHDVGMDESDVKEKINELNQSYKQLNELADNRELELHNTRKVWEYIEDLDNDKEWIKEINQLLINPDIGHDLSSVERLIRKNDQLLSDIKIRKDYINEKLDDGDKKIMTETLPERKELIITCIDEIRDLLKQLDDNCINRQSSLNESRIYYQLLADIDDTDVTILEEVRILDNLELGDNLVITQCYLKKYDEEMLHIDEIDKIVLQLNQSYDNLNKSDLDKTRYDALKKSYDKMIEDYEYLKRHCQLKHDLLTKNKNKFDTINDLDVIETWINAKEKLLESFVPTEEMDELNVIKHRFDCFEDEMKKHSNDVSEINNTSKELLDDKTIDSDELNDKLSLLNRDWNQLADLYDSKKQELDKCMGFNEFIIECQSTTQWIQEKQKLLEWSDELGEDLDSIMQLQRRLGSLERDVKAIEAKVNHLNEQVPKMKEYKPNSSERIDEEIHHVNIEWEQLKQMLQERDAKLHNSSQLQKFLQDLDAFNVWLSNVQTQVATQDIPKDLLEAEKFQTQHDQLNDEILLWEPEYTRLMNFGREICDSKDEPQYILFNQRLDALEEGWKLLLKMYDDKSITLQQSIDANTFLRDAAQIELTLSSQESFLSKEDKPKSVEEAQAMEREFENFKVSVASNRPKIESVLSFGEKLIPTNALSDRINTKCENIRDRCDVIDAKMKKRDNHIKGEMVLLEYFEDVDDFEELIEEKKLQLSEIGSGTTKDVTSKYNKFKELERQLEENENHLKELKDNGDKLIENNEEFKEEIEPKLQELEEQWNNLMKSVKEKSDEIEDANREIIFGENAQNIMVFLDDIESQIITTEETTEEIGLVELEQKMKDQDEKDKQFEQKRKILNDMAEHAEKLKAQYPEREVEFEEIQQQVKVKLTQAEAPLTNRRNKLSQQKRVRQFQRDIDDELEWIKEKEDVLDKLNVQPDNLQNCEQKQRRLKTMDNEVDNHQPRIDEIIKNGEDMINEDFPNSDKFQSKLDQLTTDWNNLRGHIELCNDSLNDSHEVCQYLFDGNSTKDWIEEHEIEMLKDEKVKDENGAQNAIRKHECLMKTINDFEDEIVNLKQRHDDILSRSLPGSEKVAEMQPILEKNYQNLKDMCLEQRMRIDDLVTLYQLLVSIQDLEEWIQERTVVASSNETGSDLEHCTLLRDRFSEFSRETNEQGNPRVEAADKWCDQLIDDGHREAAQIARWKDLINEMWADLLELIETRIQLLKSAYDFYKFMSDSSELLELIQEKFNQIPETVGKDAKTVAAYLRRLNTFKSEVERLQPLIDGEIATADNLRPLYSGNKEEDILTRKRQLEEQWHRLKKSLEDYRLALVDNDDLYRFFAMVRELINWYSEIDLQLTSEDKPRDCCGVDIIISNHKSLKAEIDSRDENRSVCLGLGRTLVNNKHRNRDDIRKKCREVIQKHHYLVEKWRDRKEYLDLILEVYQFARDAAVAEAWLIAQEPHVRTNDCGDSLDETLALLQRHNVLEKSLEVQLERFDSLRKLTRMEQLGGPENEAKRVETKRVSDERLKRTESEFYTPPPSPKPQPKPRRTQPQDVEADKNIQEEEIIAPIVASLAASAPKDVKQETKDTGGPIDDSKPEPPKPKSGPLSRKHEWESDTKKAGNRAWHDLYAILDNATLKFYKDEKKSRDINATYKNEVGLDLIGALASPANLYKKKQNVFRLKLASGAEYLCHTRTGDDMESWVNAINSVTGTTGAQSKAINEQDKYSTLPSPSAIQQASSTGAKTKFTTLGRKK